MGIGIIWLKGEVATKHLYSLPEYAMSSFTTIETSNSYTIAAICIFLVGGKMLWDYKFSGAVSTVVQSVFSKNVNEFVDKTPRPKDEDDGQI